MAKKGFSVGKDALFKKIMPTNQDAEELSVPESQEVDDHSEITIGESLAETSDMGQRESQIKQSMSSSNFELGKGSEPETFEKDSQQMNFMPPIQEPRPMVYGLPEDKQPLQYQGQAQYSGQPQMQTYYSQQGYPQGQIAYSMMQTQGMPYGYPQGMMPYMPMQGYPYMPVVQPQGNIADGVQMKPWQNPNNAMAAMYYANATTSEQLPYGMAPMMVDRNQMTIYDMLDDFPPIGPDNTQEAHESITNQIGDAHQESKLQTNKSIDIVDENAVNLTVAENGVPQITVKNKWQLRNVMEQLVEEKAIELMRRDGEICMCEKCILDVTANALNKLPGIYTTTFSPAMLDYNYKAHMSHILVALYDAIEQIKNHPQHMEEGTSHV